MEILKYANPRFVHLHLHTEYSPMDAPASLKKLVKRAKELNYKSLAVTDHGTVGAWVKFAKLCKESEIKPIFGMEGYFVPDRRIKEGKRANYHIVLLAKNNVGMKNLMRISQIAWLEGYYYDPRLDWELLEQYGEGLVCTSACVSGIVPDTLATEGMEPAKKVAQRFKDMFKDDFYVEVQNHAAEIELKHPDGGYENIYCGMAKLAADMKIKIVGTNDVHYINKEDANVQEVLMSLKGHRCIKDPNRMRHDVNQYYFKSPEEMLEIFGKGTQATESTLEIMDKCNAELEAGKTQLPSLEIPKEFPDSYDFMESLAWAGLKHFGKDQDQVYRDRLQMELNVVKQIRDEKGLRFDRYFLVVWDYVNWAKKNGIRVGAGRGSGAGSLVLYCLNITTLDPIEHDLLFERFLTVDRNEMPDIDVDFDKERVHEVFEYCRTKYGAANFARIGTVTTFQVAGAIKNAFRVFDPMGTYEQENRDVETAKASRKQAKHEYSKGHASSKKKPRDETASFANEVTARLREGDVEVDDPEQLEKQGSKFTLLKDVWEADKDNKIWLYNDPYFRSLKQQYPEVFDFAEKIEGLVDKRGVHAAGVIMTDCPMIEFIPQHLVGAEEKKDKIPATMWDMGDVEYLGGIKFDQLSLKGLTVITRAVNMITKNDGGLRDSAGREIDIEYIPLDDPAVIRLFAEGNTLAIFQFEGDGMIRTLQKMQPTKFEHLTAANALYRPGPMEYIDTYCARRRGDERVQYPAPSVRQILEKTFGIMVYQEQVMQITSALAGFSGSEADKVRKAMGKKKREVLDKMKDKFLKGCKERGTISEQGAQQVWNDMESFASYAFNKSHAAAYSKIAYQMAFLKHYYPAEFMAAQLSVEANDGKFDTVTKYQNGTSKMGITIRGLDLNKSKANYTVEEYKGKRAIRKGFLGIKGVGESAALDIERNAPYSSMFDYCMRSGAGSKSDVVKVMADEGAFDEAFSAHLQKKLGRKPTTQSYIDEYADQVKRATKEKKVSGAEKEEREGIGFIFNPDAAKRPEESFSLGELL